MKRLLEKIGKRGVAAAAGALLGLAVVLAAAAFLIFSVRTGGHVHLGLDVYDARADELSCEDYAAAAERYPNKLIRWSVPVGGERFDSFSKTITLRSLGADEVGNLKYFPYLEKIDARECSDYAALAEACRELEGVGIDWSVPSTDGDIPGSTGTLAVRAMQPEEIKALIPLLPKLERLDLRGAEMDEGSVDALAAELTELEVKYTVRFWGMEAPEDCEELVLPEGSYGDPKELETAMGRLKKLGRADVSLSGLGPFEVAELLEKFPDIRIDYAIRIGSARADADSEELDVSGVQLDGPEEVETAIGLMPNVKKVVMCDCGIPDEEMDALNRKYEDVRFVWMLHFSVYSLRTDATIFCASDLPPHYLAPEMTDEELEPIKYCTDLIALDLGHMRYTDLSFLYNMPHLKYLILVEARYHDITPIGSLEELEYLEIFMNRIDDISPLTNCKKLKHLNMCYCFGFDPEPVKQLTSLERLWWVGAFPSYVIKNSISEALSDTYCYMPYTDPQGSTGGGWREDPAYFEMRDVFGMYYQPGGTGIH